MVRWAAKGKGAHTSPRLKTDAGAREDGGAGAVRRVQHLAIHLGVQGGKPGVAIKDGLESALQGMAAATRTGQKA